MKNFQFRPFLYDNIYLLPHLVEHIMAIFKRRNFFRNIVTKRNPRVHQPHPLYHSGGMRLLVWGGGGQGGLNLPLPVPCNPGSPLCIFWLPSLCIFSIAKYCAMLRNFSLFLLLPATLGIPLPAPSSPASRTPPAPFSPVLPPPCPPPPLVCMRVNPDRKK